MDRSRFHGLEHCGELDIADVSATAPPTSADNVTINAGAGTDTVTGSGALESRAVDPLVDRARLGQPHRLRLPGYNPDR